MKNMKEYTTENSFCQKCGLYKEAQHSCLIGRGDFSSKILIIGECPGRTEDAQGEVFIGRSGQYLDYVLQRTGVTCFITNAVLCRPIDSSGKNKTPTPTQIDSCKPFTIDIIRSMKPKVIITLGRIALNQLTGLSIGMEIIRGKELFHPELNTTIIPTYHPAYLLRRNDSKLNNEFISDFEHSLKISKSASPRKIESVAKTLTDPIEIDKYFESLLGVESVAIDLETTGLNPRKDHITDISLCHEIGKGVHIKWDYITEDPRRLNILREMLLSDTIKVFHNASFDIQFLRAINLDVKMPIFDTMLAYHTLTMSVKGGGAGALYRLKTLAWFITMYGGYETVLDSFGGIGGIQSSNTDVFPLEKLPEKKALFDSDEINNLMGINSELEVQLKESYDYINKIKASTVKKLGLKPIEFYSAMDADVTYRIFKYLKMQIDDKFHYVFYTIIMPLTLVLIRIHENGIKIDVPYIKKLIDENTKEAEKIKQKFFKKIGEKINLNSPEKLRELIYVKLGATVMQQYKTKKSNNPSTDEAAIAFFSKKYPVLKHILTYRTIQKQTSTYLNGYLKLADENGRVYPSYKQLGTVTGRISATNPNLQNIPRDNRIRNMIIPSEGNKIIIADLSQVELRILSLVSNDPYMQQAFRDDHDFHTYTACSMFGIPIESFDKKNKDHAEKRSQAKTINFGMVYLQRAETLAKDLGISLEKAVGFHRKFFKTFPKVGEWIEATKAFVYEHGYVETLYGRRRYLPGIRSSDDNKRGEAERQAINTPIQGSAGDVCFFGLIRFQEWIDENNKKTKIIGTVHDSILADVPLDEVDEVAHILPQMMTKDIPRITIPLKADVDILDKWEK